MTREQFAKFSMALKTYFPRENLLPNTQAMELWYNQLGDIPYELAEAGLQKWVATEKWSPTIADIRGMASGIQNGDIPDWGDAWEKVQKAIRRYGSYQPAEALESLPELARIAVKQIGWRNLCFSENEAADRANFRICYERAAERKKADAMIPDRLKNIIGKMQVGMIEKGETEG